MNRHETRSRMENLNYLNLLYFDFEYFFALETKTVLPSQPSSSGWVFWHPGPSALCSHQPAWSETEMDSQKHFKWISFAILAVLSTESEPCLCSAFSNHSVHKLLSGRTRIQCKRRNCALLGALLCCPLKIVATFKLSFSLHFQSAENSDSWTCTFD